VLQAVVMDRNRERRAGPGTTLGKGPAVLSRARSKVSSAPIITVNSGQRLASICNRLQRGDPSRHIGLAPRDSGRPKRNGAQGNVPCRIWRHTVVRDSATRLETSLPRRSLGGTIFRLSVVMRKRRP
jgi:hypothetical protein